MVIRHMAVVDGMVVLRAGQADCENDFSQEECPSATGLLKAIEGNAETEDLTGFDALELDSRRRAQINDFVVLELAV